MSPPSDIQRTPAANVAARPLAKLSAAAPATFRPHLDLPEEAAAAYDASKDATEALAALETGGFLLPAVRLLAHALPRREAVWWGCMCARHTNPALAAAEVACLTAAELWVRQPTDENRRAAFAGAEASGFATPAAWACAAVFWNGDSMSPLGQPAVPPAPHLSGLALAGAVTLASVHGQPQNQRRRLVAFIASARDIATGGNGRMEPEAT